MTVYTTCRVGRGQRRHHCSCWHTELVDSYRLAVADQEARAEAWSHGYAPELAAFYRDIEARLTFKHWLQHYRDTTRQRWLRAA